MRECGLSSVIVVPDALDAASVDLASLRESFSAVHQAAVAPTVSIPPAAADEISAALSAAFSEFARSYHAAAAAVGLDLDIFAHKLTDTLRAYTTADIGNADPLAGTIFDLPAQLIVQFAERMLNPISVIGGEIYALFQMLYQILYSSLMFWWIMFNFAGAVIQNQLQYGFPSAIVNAVLSSFTGMGSTAG